LVVVCVNEASDLKKEIKSTQGILDLAEIKADEKLSNSKITKELTKQLSINIELLRASAKVLASEITEKLKLQTTYNAEKKRINHELDEKGKYE